MRLAERGRFELPVGYEPTHAFQACALNHSAISPANHITLKNPFSERNLFSTWQESDSKARLPPPYLCPSVCIRGFQLPGHGSRPDYCLISSVRKSSAMVISNSGKSFSLKISLPARMPFSTMPYWLA